MANVTRSLRPLRLGVEIVNRYVSVGLPNASSEPSVEDDNQLSDYQTGHRFEARGGLVIKHPLLYFTTIVFLLVILSTLLLLIYRACFRNCLFAPDRRESSAGTYPVFSDRRPNRIMTDAISINDRRSSLDKPPDYATVVTMDTQVIVGFCNNGQLFPVQNVNRQLTQTPPPSYGSIVF